MKNEHVDMAGSTSETTHLLVVVVDISEAFNKSSEVENPSQRVRVKCLHVCVIKYDLL